MQGRLKKLLRFIKRQRDTDSQTNKRQEKKEEKSFNIYRSIHKLPLSVFIDVMLDKKLEALIIDGEPSKEELKKAWDIIIEEYADVNNKVDVNKEVKIYKRIVRLQFVIAGVELLLPVLEMVFVKQFAERLRDLIGRELLFNEESYESDLKISRVVLGTSKQELKLEKIQLHGLEEKVEDKEELSREYFSEMLLNLSDHAGYELKEEAITVYKFLERVKRLSDHIKRQVAK